MERALYHLLNQEQSQTIQLRGQNLIMVLLTAQELLEIRFAGDQAADEFSKALHSGAALAAKALQDKDEKLFASAEEVLRTLSAEEINHIVESYNRWSEEIDPGFGCGEETIEVLKKA